MLERKRQNYFSKENQLYFPKALCLTAIHGYVDTSSQGWLPQEIKIIIVSQFAFIQL